MNPGSHVGINLVTQVIIHYNEGCNSRSCFTSVECRDTVNGPVCGPCHLGYIGDGQSCEPRVTCRDKPCYAGSYTL